MSTTEQLTANRQNAKKSTGPRTEAGKARSRLNSLNHGMRSEEVVIRGESREAYDRHLAAWMADWNPPTMARAALVEKLAATSWRTKRIVRMQNERMNQRYANACTQFDQDKMAAATALLQQLNSDPAATNGSKHRKSGRKRTRIFATSSSVPTRKASTASAPTS